MQRNIVSCQPVAYHGALVHHALRNLDTQLGRAGSDDWVDLLGHDQQRYASGSQPLNPEPVGPADANRLATILRNSDGIVRVNAIEVGDHRIDIDILRQLHHFGQCACQCQVMEVVDIDCGQLGHLDHGGTSEEAMPGSAEPGCRHDIERSRLAELGFSLLTSQPDSRVVILSRHHAEASAAAPQEVIGRHRREDRVGMIMDDHLDTSIKIIRRDEWAGALYEYQHLRLLIHHDQLVEGVEQRRFRRGDIVGQLSGSHDHLCAGHFSACRDLGIVRADVHLSYAPCRSAGVDRARNQAASADPPKVLARHDFGATACRNYGNHS